MTAWAYSRRFLIIGGSDAGIRAAPRGNLVGQFFSYPTGRFRKRA
jgi:hypothetical protein